MAGHARRDRISDADRHQHRRQDDAGDDVVAQPGRARIARRVCRPGSQPSPALRAHGHAPGSVDASSPGICAGPRGVRRGMSGSASASRTFPSWACRRSGGSCACLQRRAFLAGHVIEEVAQQSQPAKLLVVEIDQGPGRIFGVGRLQHRLPRPGIIIVLRARLEIDRRQFPPLHGVAQAAPGTSSPAPPGRRSDNI